MKVFAIDYGTNARDVNLHVCRGILMLATVAAFIAGLLLGLVL